MNHLLEGPLKSNAGVSLPMLLSVVLGSVLVSAETASAQLTMCNRSSESVAIAVAYSDGGDTVSRGWYRAEPGECPVVVTGPLRNRYYYVRAEGQSGARWDGGRAFCATDGRFTSRGNDCLRDGLDSRSFFAIDTGESSAWTHALTGRAKTTQPTPVREVIANLRVSWRPSLLDDGSLVMVLNNGTATTVDVNLTCRTRSGFLKALVVRVPGHGVGEVGFVQGWTGNFVRGEACDAHDGSGELIWRASVPR